MIAGEKWRDCAIIVALFALPVLFLWPFQDAAFVDDWIYHWSVEHFLKTGELAILEISTAVHPVQTLWGALFCTLSGGFSFAADRFSTWVLAASTLCAVYLLVRDLSGSRRDALLGAALLGTCPLFVILSVSFMTDVPFVACATWATYALVCAVRKQSNRWLIAAVALSLLATGVRLNAAVLPLAMFLMLLLHAGRWGRSAWRLALSLLPLVCLAGMLLWHKHHTVVTADLSELGNAPAQRLTVLKEYGLPLLPRMSAVSVFFTIAVGGCALLPLSLAELKLPRKQLVQIAVLFIVLVAIDGYMRHVRQSPYMPLSAGATWRIEELGSTTDLTPHQRQPGAHPMWVIRAIYYVSLLGGTFLIVRGLLRRPLAGEQAIRWMIAGQILLSALLFLFYDRYILPFLPLLIVLTLAASPARHWRWMLGGIVIFAALSFAGLRDHLAFNRALWHAVRVLHEQGIPPSQIDAGYVVNGWFQYAHPETAPRDARGKIAIPWVATNDRLPWVVSTTPMEGYEEVRQQTVKRWLGPDVTLRVMKMR